MRLRNLTYQGKSVDVVRDRAMPGGMKFSEWNSPATSGEERVMVIEPASDQEIEMAFRAASDRAEKKLGRVFGRFWPG